MTSELLPIIPKNYRSFLLHLINSLESPKILCDGIEVTDLSENGPITRNGLKKITNFSVFDGAIKVMGFHDSPNESWILSSHKHLVDYGVEMGWIKCN